MGLLLGAWTVVERLTEESVLALVSGCTAYRTGDSPAVVYAEGELRMSCTVTYERSGHPITVKLDARLPGDFDARQESRHAQISVSPLNPRLVRFSSYPFDWETPVALVLTFELVGALLALRARR